MRRLWRLFGWFVAVDLLITIFGVTTAPLLAVLALDAAIGLLVIRLCIEMGPRMRFALVAAVRFVYREGAG